MSRHSVGLVWGDGGAAAAASKSQVETGRASDVMFGCESKQNYRFVSFDKRDKHKTW